jgi:hypothetical protein
MVTYHAMMQSVETLHHMAGGRVFESRLCHLGFFIDINLPAALWAWSRHSLEQK